MNQLSSITPLEIILIGFAAVGIFLFFRACWRNIKRSRQHLGVALLTLVMTLTAQTAWAQTTSTITVGGTDYTLFTGFTATSGTNVSAAAFSYPNMVDGNLDWLSSWHLNGEAQPYYIEFNSDEPIIPKGYIFNTYSADDYKPTDWVLKAKADAGDSWTTLSSKSGQSLADGQEFQYDCNNSGNNAYKYFRFEVAESRNNIWLTEIRLYGSIPNVYYTHLTVRAATCTETGIKQDCYQRNDGKYFTDETGTTELAESAVIDPMIPHTCVHHEATDVNIEYWQCSMCSKYFSDSGYTTEITEEVTKIYRTITIDDGISSLVTSSVDKALAGATVTLTVSHLIDTSTLQVNNGNVALTNAGNGTYTFTVPAADVIVTASILSTYSITLPANMAIVSATNAADSNGKYISGTVIKFAASLGYEATNVSDGTNTLEPDANGIYTVTVAEADINITATTESSNTIYLARATSDFTAADGNILIGATSHTVTIANNAKITLSGVTITGGIVCAGTAEITLVGENAVGVTSLDGTLIYQTAGIQIGSNGKTLTIKGNGSLNATGGSAAAGIGLGRTWDANATGGSVVIEGGTVTASGGNGIGTGTVGNEKTATIGNIVIKGGTVNARLGKGIINNGSTATIGTIKIYDTIDKVDASAITESVTYMHVDGNTETDVTASASTYFTIIEDGDRRVITPKDDTDYTITIADDIEHGSIACAATTAKFGDKVTITATPDFGYRLSRLVVKDAENNDVASTGNSFFMPKGDVTVSAVFEQGTHGTTEFSWGYFGPDAFVTEASIYDGLTTVNLQQGQSYQILKYDNYSYRKFLLDNVIYNVTIPYSGGTGTFTDGNGTDFRVDYNGESGYYDVTMTDVGNGKWSVSILKTVGVIDNIPDQTYTGSEITPEPLVLAGSLSLTKGTDYEYSYTNNTNVGTATVTVTFKGDYASLGYVEKEFEIVPKSMTNNDISITIPEQTWTGNELTPVITVKDGENVLTENTDYTVTPPSGPVEDSGNHAYTITGMGNYAGSREAMFTITPYLADQFGAVYVYQDQNGKTALLEGSSVEDIVNCPEFTAQKVTYTRTFTTPKATIVLPFAVSQEDADAAGTFYKFYNVSSEFHVQMQQVKTGGLEAGVPYIVVPKNTTDPVTFETTTPVAFPLTEPSEFTGNSTKWTFNGRYSTKIFNTLDANELVYFFAANEQDNAKLGDFVKVAASETTRILPFRAYIRCANKTTLARGNGATRGFPTTLPVYAIGNDGNETTQIGTISIEMDDDDWYSLDGRKLSGKPNKKGLYIHKGNKVAIK